MLARPEGRRTPSGVRLRAGGSIVVLAALLAGSLPARAADETNPRADPAIPSYRPMPVPRPQGHDYVMRDGSLRILGFDDMSGMIERWDALFTKTHPDIRFTPMLKGNGSAIPAITYDTTVFAPEGGGATLLELLPYEKIYGSKKEPIGALIVRVAHGSLDPSATMSPLGIVVNKSNPIRSLTEKDVAAIFTTGSGDGDVVDWGQIGLTGALAGKPIHPTGLYWDNYMRADDPNVGEFMMYRHSGPYPGHVFTPSYEQYFHYADVTREVASDPQAIGIVALNKLTPDVRVVPIVGKDGRPTTGTRDELTADAYPYARDLYIYIRREPNTPFDPVVKEYMRLILSKEGQEAVAADAKGYLPLNEADVAKERLRLDKAETWGPRSKQGPKLNFPFPSPFPLDEDGQAQ